MSGPNRDAFDDVDAVFAAIERALETGVRVVTVDGAAGSGKTTLAARLAERFPELTLVRLDEMYPGWNGLSAGIEIAKTHVVAPLVAGESPRWPLWDWIADAPGALDSLPAGTRILLEGCGATAAADPAADAGVSVFRVWCEAPLDECEARFIARDGDAVRPWVPIWTAQWLGYLEREAPQERIELSVDTSGA